ncbi:MAG: hypothetical protein MI919_28220, partial [Holophagales bacterium]|nr:hypothetical protein [Holophagales bacterium]
LFAKAGGTYGHASRITESRARRLPLIPGGGFLAVVPSVGAPASCRLFLFAEAGGTPALRRSDLLRPQINLFG